MGSKRKSTTNRKYKEIYHSRSHRNRKSSRNSSQFIEPFYLADPMLPYSNNVPLFFQTPFYGPTQSSWSPLPSAGHINPPTSPLFPNINHPAQLSIGPLYLLGKGSEVEQNPVPLKELNSNSIGMNKTMQKNALHELPPYAIKNGKPTSLKLAGETYSLPTTTEVYNSINTMKSQNHTRRNLIDTPTQYDYEIPVSKRIGSCLSYKWPVENSETSCLASLQSNESCNEKQCDSSVSPAEYPRGNLTVMRVSQDEAANPSQAIEGSTLNQDLSWNKKKRGNCRKIYIEVPVGIHNLDNKRTDKIRVKCEPRQMKVETEYSKRLYCNKYRSAKRDYRKVRDVREMTTEDSINDLYRKINDIQYSLGASRVNDLLVNNANHEIGPASRSVAFEQCVHLGQVPFYKTDMAVGRTNTVNRSISPINFSTIENIGSCCCFCCPQRVRNVLETRVSSHDLTCPELSNNPIQGSSEYFSNHSFHQKDGIHYGEMHYPPSNTPFQTDTGCIESRPLRNKNVRIVIDQDAECQSPSMPLHEHDAYSLPIQEACSRPCNCPQNTASNSYTKCVICCDDIESMPKEFPGKRFSNLISNGPTTSGRYSATKDNSTLCTSSDLLANPENLPVPKASIEQTRPCGCPRNPCNCDFNKELYDIINKIEDNIISKLERKTFLIHDESRPEEIQNYKISKSVQIRDSDLAELSNLPTRLEGSRDNTSELRKSIREGKYVNSIQEQNESDDQFLIKEQPRSSLKSEIRQVRDSEYNFDQDYGQEPRVSDFNKSADDKNEYKRSTKTSSELRRSTREKRKDSSFGSGRRSTFSFPRRRSRKSESVNEKRPFSSVKRNSENRYSGQSSVQVLTAVPYYENCMKSSQYDLKLSKNLVNHVNDKYLFSNSSVNLNEKDGKNTNNYQIRKIKLPGPKRHIYILIKRRNGERKISSKESKKTINISSTGARGLKGIPAEKNYLLKEIEPEKVRKIYIKTK